MMTCAGCPPAPPLRATRPEHYPGLLRSYMKTKKPGPPRGGRAQPGRTTLARGLLKGAGQWLPIASPSMPGLAEFLGSTKFFKAHPMPFSSKVERFSHTSCKCIECMGLAKNTRGLRLNRSAPRFKGEATFFGKRDIFLGERAVPPPECFH